MKYSSFTSIRSLFLVVLVFAVSAMLRNIFTSMSIDTLGTAPSSPPQLRRRALPSNDAAENSLAALGDVAARLGASGGATPARIALATCEDHPLDSFYNKTDPNYNNGNVQERLPYHVCIEKFFFEKENKKNMKMYYVFFFKKNFFFKFFGMKCRQ